ncbi:TetR/AcrR family transcriptional regulator [Jiangella ureilytica]|uniref:TetR/AcrR family transcriptional regulator n=1 Tax=Jiangella ureilytica TaxID=2530374 RepID=A0A4V2XXH9_9ACTN|nr:TetR/AcrR family transcriptional regulator [Jiangella ureilytica]
MATAERIRDAAIVRFGRDGFAIGLRTVAADAGVTAGLVVHHFGSKDALRRACDEHVLAVIRAEKTKAVTTGTAAMLFAQLAQIEHFAPMVRYLVRSLQSGGDLASALVEHLMADAQRYLAAGVEAGVIRPSRDPEARSRFLAYQNIGGMLLWASMHLDDHPDDFSAAFRRYSEEITPPALELFSQGLFVDRSMLDDYLMYVPDPPSADDAAPTAS